MKTNGFRTRYKERLRQLKLRQIADVKVQDRRSVDDGMTASSSVTQRKLQQTAVPEEQLYRLMMGKPKVGRAPLKAIADDGHLAGWLVLADPCKHRRYLRHIWLDHQLEDGHPERWQICEGAELEDHNGT